MTKDGGPAGLPKRLLIAAGVFLLAFPVFAVLHNLLYALGELIGEVPLISPALEYTHVVAFLVAVTVCPVGFVAFLVAALVGWLVARARR